jgi:hypothetical protein
LGRQDSLDRGSRAADPGYAVRNLEHRVGKSSRQLITPA